MTDPAFLSDAYDGDTPSLAEVCEMAARQALAQFWACVPARVTAYDPATGLADLQPAVQVVGADGEMRTLPAVPACRVLFPSGGGAAGWHLTFDLEPDDVGLLIVSSACVSQWMETADEAAAPESARRGSLSDGFFLPAYLPKTLPHDDPEGLSLGQQGARVHISRSGGVTIESGDVRLGSAGAASAVVLDVALSSFLTTLKTWLDTHTHTSAAPASPTSPPIAPSPASSGLGAGKVKAE